CCVWRCLVVELADCVFVFFFQAEDGIRDRNVTGVQTCALPISAVESVEAGGPGALGDLYDEVDVGAEFGGAVGVAEDAPVRTGELSGEEVEPAQAHAGGVDGGDEVVDLGLGRGGCVPGPPELDSVEACVTGGLGACVDRKFGEQQRAVHGVAEGVAHGSRLRGFRGVEYGFHFEECLECASGSLRLSSTRRRRSAPPPPAKLDPRRHMRPTGHAKSSNFSKSSYEDTDQRVS